MEVVQPRCAGLDVSKRDVKVAAIPTPQGQLEVAVPGLAGGAIVALISTPWPFDHTRRGWRAKKWVSSSAAPLGGCSATCSGWHRQLRALRVWHRAAHRAVDSTVMRPGAGS